MEKLMTYLRRKSHIEYEMNCVEKYIQGGDVDLYLKLTQDLRGKLTHPRGETSK